MQAKFISSGTQTKKGFLVSAFDNSTNWKMSTCDGTLVATGKLLLLNLYCLEASFVLPLCTATPAALSDKDTFLWHLKLEHASYYYVFETMKMVEGGQSNLPSQAQYHYEACVQA